jgi:hypothetical protein
MAPCGGSPATATGGAARPDSRPDARAELDASLDRLRRLCDEAGRDYAELLRRVGALSAGEAHFDLLAEAGVAMCDLMLETPEDLDLRAAESFLEKMAPLRLTGDGLSA